MSLAIAICSEFEYACMGLSISPAGSYMVYICTCVHSLVTRDWPIMLNFLPIMLLSSAQRNNPLCIMLNVMLIIRYYTAISYSIVHKHNIESNNYLMSGCNVQYQEFMIVCMC